MNQITADETVQDFLRGLLEPVEIRDEAGKTLGHYTPLVSPEEAALYEKAKAMFDPEEMRRIAATEHGQGLPLSEVLRRLESGETP